MNDLLEKIPFGKKNAISRTRLRIITGLRDRSIREEISRLRRDNAILNTQDGKGYYRPAEEDKEDVRRWVAQETSRARSIFWSMHGARQFLDKE